MSPVINLSPVENRNPIKDPSAALKALPESLLSNIISPINAPTKGPIIIPKGGKKMSPTNNPIVVPYIPYLLPPNFLVPKAGMI